MGGVDGDGKSMPAGEAARSMSVARFLGAGWASVHGPSDPRSFLLWTLDRGFRGLAPAPAPRALDWAALEQARADLPFVFGPARVSAWSAAEPAEAGLASVRSGEAFLARPAIAEAIRRGRVLRSPRIILDPGLVAVSGEVVHTDLGDKRAKWTEDGARAMLARRNAVLDRALDLACRNLHRLCRSLPEFDFHLTLSRNVLSLGEPQALAAIFEDLGGLLSGYWHDAAAAACRERWLGEAPGEVLEARAKHLSGMTLSDYGGGEYGLPPGAGGVDYPLLGAYRQRSAAAFPVVVEMDPGVAPEELPGVHAFLSKFGL